MVNNSGSGANYTVFQKSPQTATDAASLPWMTKAPSTGTSIDWTKSYTYDDLTAAVAQTRPSPQPNADGSFAYDISGSAQNWVLPTANVLYL
ncbi:MAG: hypothetical protein CTR54_00670 [Rhizobium sp.]|nr:MAG: hypothetical protein CTR54_00670 [Rhizobium sp.]